MSAKTITALPFVLCSVLADACDTFTISGRVADQGSGLDTWIGVFQDPLAEQAEPVESTWVDAGEFELEVPCAESVTLLAVRKGVVPLARRISGSAPTAVDLRFAPGLSLTGSVHSDENLPIGGARVSVTRIDEAEVRLPESLTTWRSSKDGAFVAEGLAPGTYRVAASADGHMPVELPEVVVGEGGANRVDMRLPRAFFIAGRVVDTSGLAVAGAEIHGEPSMSGGTTAETTATSDSEGGFRLGPFRKAQEVLISARANLSRLPRYAYYVAPMDDLVLTLHHAVEIRGSVSNAFTGELLNDIALRAYGRGEGRSLAFRDAAGEFSAAVFWHTHYIVISAPGFVSWYTPVDFGSGGGDHDFGDVALEPERVATGRVLDAASGLPVQGASVRRWFRHALGSRFDMSDFRNRLQLVATTDEDGRFRLSGLPRGDVLLQAQPKGYSRDAVVELPAGTDHIDIEVNLATTTIEGMLVTEEGTPAKGHVYIWKKDGDDGEMERNGQSVEREEDGGAYQLRGVPLGQAGASTRANSGSCYHSGRGGAVSAGGRFRYGACRESNSDDLEQRGHGDPARRATADLVPGVGTVVPLSEGLTIHVSASGGGTRHERDSFAPGRGRERPSGSSVFVVGWTLLPARRSRGTFHPEWRKSSGHRRGRRAAVAQSPGSSSPTAMEKPSSTWFSPAPPGSAAW